MSKPTKTCIVIAGPTAAGKTSLAMKVASHFDTKIISADSRQCYRELNIGVAKPTAAQLAAIPHYFINSHSIFQEVNASGFENYALAAAEEIFQTSDYAVLVGGTGLYIKAFCEGMDDIPAIPPEIRLQVMSDYEQFGIQWLKEQVGDAHINEHHGELDNPQRLMRALEVKRYTGLPINSFHTKNIKRRPFNIVKTGIDLPRELLYKNINERVDQMMQDGLLEEARALHPHARLNALQTVGYQELFDFFDGRISLDEAINDIKKHTRHYAKRQLTWFRKDQLTTWFNPADYNQLMDFLLAGNYTK